MENNLYSLIHKKTILSFIILCSIITILLTYINQRLILTDKCYYNSFIEQTSAEKIEVLIDNKDNIFSFLFGPIFMLIKILLISVPIYIGIILINIKITFQDLFKIVAISELIFFIPMIIKIIWFYFFDKEYILNDLVNFYPLSALSLFDFKNVEPFLIYPLQILNFFELFYSLFLAYGISKVIKIDLQRGMKIVLSTYIPTIILWVVFVTFLSLNAT